MAAQFQIALVSAPRTRARVRQFPELYLPLLVAIVGVLGCTLTGEQKLSDLVGKRLAARVVGVVDGDTVDVVIPPSRRLRVRIHGIDTPESGEPFNQSATKFVRVLTFSRDVIIEGRDVDVHDRLVARVLVGGEDASIAILSAGLACHYRKYDQDPLLESAEQRARAGGRGFWATGAARPRCVARETLAQSVSKAGDVARVQQGGFVGNARSLLFHSITCPNSSCANCSRRFRTEEDAVGAGFRPAKDCIARQSRLDR